MSESTLVSDAEVFTDLLNSGTGNLDPDAARAVLRLRFSPAQDARMRELAERHSRGELSEAEHAEIERFRRVGNFLVLIQSKERFSLRQEGSSGLAPNGTFGNDATL